MKENGVKTGYRFDSFVLEAESLLLLLEGKPVALTPKVIETLLVLVEANGDLVTKEELIRRLWPDSIVEESNISQNLYLLRKALGEMPGGGSYIETLRRRGYRFCGKAVRVDSNGTPVDQEASRDQDVRSGPGLISRSNPLRLILIVVFALSAVGLGGWALFKRATSHAPATSPPTGFGGELVRLTSRGTISHAAISRDGCCVAYSTSEKQGDSVWFRQIAGAAELRIAGPLSSEIVAVSFSPSGEMVYFLSLDRNRGETELFRVSSLGGQATKVLNDIGPVGFSPDGESIAFVRIYGAESRLIVSRTDGSDERILASKREPEYLKSLWAAPVWSADGGVIAFSTRLSGEDGFYETVTGFDSRTGDEIKLTSEKWESVGQPGFVVGGLVVPASRDAAQTQQLWLVSSYADDVKRITNDLSDYREAAASYTGDSLIAVQKQVMTNIWLTDGFGKASVKLLSEVGGIDYIAWLGDDQFIYRSRASGTSEIWKADRTTSQTTQLTVGAFAGDGIAVTPDGSSIVFSSERKGRSDIWLVDYDGANMRQLTFGGSDAYPCVTPDGRWIVYQHGTLEPSLWKVLLTGGDPIQISASKAAVPVISPDGEYVAYKYLESKKGSWHFGVMTIDGGKSVLDKELPTSAARSLRWLRRGRSLAFATASDGEVNIWKLDLNGSEQLFRKLKGPSNLAGFDLSAGDRTIAIEQVETSDIIFMKIKPRSAD